jgi:hypothetical protein
MRRTSARLRPSPSVSSRSTRTGAGRSKLIRTLRDAGPSGGQRGVSVSSSQVPVQSRRYPFLAASDALMISSRTMAGSLAWYASRRAGSSDWTRTRSRTGTFEVRPHAAQHSSSQTSSSLPFALMRNLPEGWWRVPEQSVQGFTTAGRPDSRTTHRALRPVFTDVAAFRVQRELSRAKPRLLDLADAQQGWSPPRGRVVRLRGRPCNRPTAGMWQRSQIHAGHRVRGGEPRQLVFRLSARPARCVDREPPNVSQARSVRLMRKRNRSPFGIINSLIRTKRRHCR